MFYIRFKKNYWKNERIAHFLFFGEQCEWIAQVAFQKWAMWANRSGRSQKMSDVGELLRSLIKNEWPWGLRSYCWEEMSDHERIAQVSHQKWANEWNTHFFEQIAYSLIFGQKISDSLGKPMSEFPALFKSKNLNHFLIFLKLKIPNLK